MKLKNTNWRYQVKNLQALDSTLGEIRTVKGCEPTEGVGFFYKDGLLFQRWIPYGRDKETVVEQLVLPTKCCKMVLTLAHSIPLAGHLCKKKTTDRILQRFYWPTIHRDVAEFCRTCEACQKSSGRRAARVPLVPLPVISQPFKRIAIDIIGP